MTGPSSLSGSPRMSTLGRWAVLAYAAICYLGFLASFVGLVLFSNDVAFIPSVGPETPRSWPVALAIDLGLVLLFGLQHSVMARQSFKRAWTRVIPQSAERATYLLGTVVCLFLIYIYWSPMPTVVWHVEHAGAAYAVLALQAIGWLILVVASFSISHFELFGLAQAWSAFTGRPVPTQEFRTPGVYRFVRHPI